MKNITITNNHNRFTKEELDRLIAEAKQFELDDKMKSECIEVKNRLENYVHNVKQSISSDLVGKQIDLDIKIKLEGKCTELINFIDVHPNEMKSIYETKQKELESIWNPIIIKIHSQKKSST